jgi:fructosamine-3-kinase
MSNHAAQIESALGSGVVSLSPLHGGCVAEVVRARLEDGRDVVVKLDGGADPKLDREAFMLGVLRDAGVRVPGVIHGEPALLAMEHIENDGRRSAEGEAELARIVAELHGHSADRYGLDRDTLIGPLDQPNGWHDDWPAFYASRRIAPMADLAERRGALPRGCRERLRGLCDRMHELIPRSNGPSLIHGDLWAGLRPGPADRCRVPRRAVCAVSALPAAGARGPVRRGVWVVGGFDRPSAWVRSLADPPGDPILLCGGAP